MRTGRRELALLLALLLGACTADRPEPVATTAPPASVSASPTPGPKPYVLGVIGDFGVDAQPVRDVLKVMATWRVNAVVTTGDNGYPSGTAAEEAFASGLLRTLHAPVYAALGNHDWRTEFARPAMAAFGLPGPYYDVVLGPVHLIVLDATHAHDPAQLAYLDRVLAAKRRAPWRVVAFHQPAISCSFHGPDQAVQSTFVRAFRDRVDLVLSGHNHTYERFTGPAGVAYLTTGGGGAQLYPSVPGRCRGPGRVRYMRTAHHAVRISATPHRLLVEGVGVDGVVFDSYERSR